MFSISSKGLLTLLATIAFAPLAIAQSYPTSTALMRMTRVESRFGRGSAFSMDVDGREYWITAKHILTGARHPPYGSISDASATLRLLRMDTLDENWTPVTFSVIDPGNNIDIVVLVPPNPLLPQNASTLEAETNVMVGADCTFLGFPEGTGGTWAASFDNGQSHYLMPYVKHCFVSAIPSGLNLFVLDGWNNPGFSGGPVLYHTGAEQKIMAVISGYVTEPAEVIPSLATNKPSGPKKTASARKKEKVDVNTGFIIAYALTPAIEAIRKNPIGPFRIAPAH
jgi:trypsin-like peptidase